LTIGLPKGIELEFDEKDEVALGLGMSLLYKSGIGSSREVGEIFRVSGVTVSRKKKRLEDKGAAGLRDGREENGREPKLNCEDRCRILKMVFDTPGKECAEILKELNATKEGKEKISGKTIERYFAENGLKEIVSRSGRKHCQGSESEKIKKEVIESRYAGIYLGIKNLAKLGFWEVIKKVKEKSPGLRSEWQLKYSIQELFLLIYGLYTETRRRRIYDLGTVSHKEYAGLIGRNRHILGSGCEKRLYELTEEVNIDEFEEEAACRLVESGILKEEVESLRNTRNLPEFYVDTHVSEVHSKENISMAMHGIKRRKVKANNKNCVVSGKRGLPVLRTISAGRRRLSQELAGLVKKLKKFYPDFILSFDKGGVSKNSLNGFCDGAKFLCWLPKWKSVKDKIEKLPMREYSEERVEETKNRWGEIKNKIVERLCETTLEFKGVGKLRVIVVYFLNTKEKAWFGTNLTKKECPTVSAREIIRNKQRVENYFKQRKCYGAMDCFGGGKAIRGKLEKPTMKKIEAVIKRTGHLLAGTDAALSDLEMSHSSLIIPDNAYRAGFKFFSERKAGLENKLERMKTLRTWVLGGKKPDFIRAPYELDLRKERILTQFQDWAYIVRAEETREFKECYRTILKRENLPAREIEEKVDNLDDTKIYRELCNLGGKLKWEHDRGILTVSLRPLSRVREQAALALMCEKRTKENTQLDFGKGRKYILKLTTC